LVFARRSVPFDAGIGIGIGIERDDMGFGHEKLEVYRAGLLFTRNRVSIERAEKINGSQLMHLLVGNGGEAPAGGWPR
jgi:hypothetical protein